MFCPKQVSSNPSGSSSESRFSLQEISTKGGTISPASWFFLVSLRHRCHSRTCPHLGYHCHRRRQEVIAKSDRLRFVGIEDDCPRLSTQRCSHHCRQRCQLLS